MTEIDDLLRDVLTSDAATQAQPDDLTARSMTAGRQIRRRRRASFAVAGVASVAMLVGGSLAVANTVGSSHAKTQVIHPAAGAPVPTWSSWPTDRTYGDKPGSGFFANEPSGTTVYASGTMPDGTEFSLYSMADPAAPIAWVQGWNDRPDFGDAPGDPGSLYDPHAPYFAFSSPTFAAGQRDDGNSQWLIVVGQPDTTLALYSADGTTWQPMQLYDGIAVLKLPAIPHSPGRIRLTDPDSGEYAHGPLKLL